MTDFTTDDIVCAYEIPGLYDGIAVYLLRDGTLASGQKRNLSSMVLFLLSEGVSNLGETK